MKILGLVASYRKFGNSEVLTREALGCAEELGVETEFLRLTDLKIEPCKGCMACVFKKEECRIEDDMYFFLDKLESSKGLVLSSPTYFLSPPGILKMILDRFLMIVNMKRKAKFAVTMGCAGLPNWEPFTLPFLNMFCRISGFDVVDSLMFYGPGPGQVLLDKNITKVSEMIQNLIDCMKNNKPKVEFPEGRCPVCYSDFFHIKNSYLECPVCKSKGRVMDGKIIFDEGGIKNHRFTEEEMRNHVNGWIMSTKEIYLKNIREINKKKEKYR